MGQDNRVDRLQARMEEQQELIAVLYKQLDEKDNHTYVGETHTLHCSDGELVIGYGNVDEDKTLVMDADQLFRDLPSIIKMVTKEQKKMQKMHHKMIKETLTEI
mgnify:CR=1 FL=1